MQMAIGINIGKVEGAINAFAKDKNADVRMVYYDQMCLWCKDLIRRMPPFAGKDMEINEAAGQEAVARDIKKIFVDMENSAVEATWTVADGIGVRTKEHGVFKVPAELDMRGNIGAVRAWHEAKRNPRTGRTRGLGSSIKIGNWKVSPRPLTDQATIDQAIGETIPHVGKLAGGWVNAWRTFKALSRSSVVLQRNSAFVEKWASGDSTDALDGTMNGFLRSGNDCPFSDKPIVRKQIEFTAGTRMKDLQYGAMKRLDALAERFNKAA